MRCHHNDDRMRDVHESVGTVNDYMRLVPCHHEALYGQDNVTRTVAIVEETDGGHSNRHHKDLLVWQQRGFGRFEISRAADPTP